MKSNYVKNNFWYFLIPFMILLLDQGSKLWVHHYMIMGSAGEIRILGDFFKLHYLTNPGMAFGIDVHGNYGKWILTLSRILVTGILGYYLYYIVKKGHAQGFVICIAIILGGAMGNVVDSTFYGVWLGNAPSHAPTPWFHGQVIDMFYINIWADFLPEYLPLIGGRYLFLWPIFNVADASISVSIVCILLFQRRFSRIVEAAARPAAPAPKEDVSLSTAEKAEP